MNFNQIYTQLKTVWADPYQPEKTFSLQPEKGLTCFEPLALPFGPYQLDQEADKVYQPKNEDTTYYIVRGVFSPKGLTSKYYLLEKFEYKGDYLFSDDTKYNETEINNFDNLVFISLTNLMQNYNSQLNIYRQSSENREKSLQKNLVKYLKSFNNNLNNDELASAVTLVWNETLSIKIFTKTVEQILKGDKYKISKDIENFLKNFHLYENFIINLCPVRQYYLSIIKNFLTEKNITFNSSKNVKTIQKSEDTQIIINEENKIEKIEDYRLKHDPRWQKIKKIVKEKGWV